MKYRPTKSKRWSDQRHNRRIIQEYGLQEAQRSGFLNLDKNNKQKKQKTSKMQTKIINKTTPQFIAEIVGELFHTLRTEFINAGGDLKDCPFDSTNKA